MPPCAHQQVGGGAERRVGGDAGIAVGAAALQREHQLARPAPSRAAPRWPSGSISLMRRDAALDGLARAAGLLDGHGAEAVALDEPVVLHQAGDLDHLAAEADQEGRRRYWDGWHSPIPCASAPRSPRPWPAMPQPVPWTKGDDAVDVGIVGEDAGAVDLLGDEAGDRGRAVHAGEDADIVARADLAVAAAIALEGRRVPRPAARAPACAPRRRRSRGRNRGTPQLCSWTCSPGRMASWQSR